MKQSSDTALAQGRAQQAWLRLDPNRRGAIWMVGAAAGFTLNSALVKAVGFSDMHAFQIAFFRTGIGFLAVLPFVWHAGPGLLRTRHPGIHLIRGIVGGGAVICGFYALTIMPLADFMALTFTTPLFMILLAVLLLGERVRWRRWSATAVGFLGVLIMVRPGAGTFELGALLALAMALGIAIASSMVKRLPVGETPAMMLFWFSLIATLLSAPLAIAVWRAPTLDQWLLLIVIGVFGVAAQSLIIRAYKVGEATFVAPFDYSKLVIAVLVGYFAFSEVPDAWTFAGAAVIIASTLYIARREATLGQAKPISEQAG